MCPVGPHPPDSSVDPMPPRDGSYARQLRDVVSRASERLSGISGDESSRRPGPGRWSPREVIGHLIDSASNNHQRFVRAQYRDDLVFPGYDQDEWVSSQRYREADWDDLVALWSGFNHHLANVMEAIPKAIRCEPRAVHNLDEIAFAKVRRDTPATLDFFMQDYVDHVVHHLRSLLGPPSVW